jgi:glycosyltransferase involved in cell wall biosynthesis
LGLSNRMLWIDEQKNMLAVYNALDICCSTSIGEGFSNAIAEAMACGVPCVVTDVGDSARIVGDTGEVIPAGESGALANALMQLIVLTQAERRQLSEKARQRIMTEFSVERMVNDTQSVFENLARRG